MSRSAGEERQLHLHDVRRECAWGSGFWGARARERTRRCDETTAFGASAPLAPASAGHRDIGIEWHRFE
eukprot:scaffold52245_cov32-Tisochrysis_lutea.AAC.6